MSFYTHVSDQYGRYFPRVITATTGEAPFVLDGLLYHQTGLSQQYVNHSGSCVPDPD